MPDIVASPPDWTRGGGADINYSINDADLAQPAPLDLYWAPTDTFDPSADTLAYSTMTATAHGTYSVHVTPQAFQSDPTNDDKYLLEVINGNQTVVESDYTNDISSVPYMPQWTGMGPDDLWSDGDNWLGGFAPTAGADLSFPGDAQQQTNVNDLGLTFNSVTVQGGNYNFSGQPLSTTGTVDFQGGSTELDCSATTAGPTTIEAGASLTMGDGATLNVLSSDPYTINGNFSLLANCEADIAGDTSVASTGQVNVAPKAKCSLEASSTSNFSGTETFADGSVLTEYGGAKLNLLANGTANLNGTATLNSYSNLNLLANTTLNSSGVLTADSQSNLTVDFGATLTQQSGSNYYFYGTAKDGGLWNLAAGATVYQYSGSYYEVAGTWNNSGNWTMEGAANSASGAKWTIDASGSALNRGDVTVGFRDTLIDSGAFRSSVGATVNLQPKAQVFIGADATWNIGGVGDPITVAAGATLDVSGTLTEDTGGFLDDFGAVTIEPTGLLADDGTVTVEAGATLDVLGTLSVGAGGSFNIAPGALYTVVTNTDDNGPGSLRQAILNANARPGSDVITFDIPGSGVQTIALASALPSITDLLTIDGWTQPGFAGTPLIELNGANAGSGANGLAITAGNSTVRGLAIDQFGQNGIVLSGGGDLITGNDIGVDADGTADGNGGVGVLIGDGASDNTIGGTTQGAGNVIAYNTRGGVAVGLNVLDAALEDAIEENSIFSNGGPGIDVNNSAPQTAPMVAGAINRGSQTTITGTFTGIPIASYRVEFFSNPPGAGQGQTYLGFTMVTTNASGSGSFSFSPASSVAQGLNITATGTDPNGNTSEFSSAVAVQLNVTNKISVKSGGLVYNRTTRQFSQTLTITNAGGTAIVGPIELVLQNVKNATLVNASGTSQGNPYITILGSGSLGAGQSLTITLTFTDPTLASIAYTSEFLAGPMPEFD